MYQYRTCELRINTREVPGAKKTENCPNGIETRGRAHDENDDWEADDSHNLILGPCWEPKIIGEFTDQLDGLEGQVEQKG